METKKLENYLIKKHCSYMDYDDPDYRLKEAHGKVTLQKIGSWLWVKARISGSFVEKWYSRADSERTSHYLDFRHDWIGLSESAPSKVSTPEELETWALLSTAYEYHEHDPYYVDDSSYLDCSGRWVEDISEDGRVTIMIASVSKRWEGVLPQVECVHETEHVQL
ncbi:MAG: hypothetical protein ACFE7R_00760 [Candidatus Hodarchaeota archaeon]